MICWAAPTDQGFDFDTVGINRRMPREFDGLKLVSFSPQPEAGRNHGNLQVKPHH